MVLVFFHSGTSLSSSSLKPRPLVPANDGDSEDGRHIQLMHHTARRRNVIRDSDTNDDVLECAVAPNKLKQHRQYSLRQGPADDHQESDNEDDDDVPPCPTAQCRRGRKQSIRMPWSNEELTLLQRAFANFWHCKTLPGYAIINKAQKQFPVLQKRTLAQIKAHFHQQKQK